MKKGLSLLLAVLMIIGLFPATVFAAAAGDSVTYKFADYTTGTQYAEDEVHVLDSDVTVTTTQCHFTTQLRIYSSSSHDGYAIIQCTNPALAFSALSVSAGNKADSLIVSGCDDGETWIPVGTIAVTSTSYNDYSLDLNGTYKYLKLDVSGSNQVRLENMTLTFAESTSGGEVESCDLTFVENGIENASAAADKYSSYTMPEATTTPAGYTFAGWVDEEITTEINTAPTQIYAPGDSYTVIGDAAFYALYTRSETVQGGDAVSSFEKVTTAPDDWSGTYLIVCEDDSFIFNGSLTTLDATSNYQAVTITDGTIDANGLTGYVFTIDQVEGGYSIQSARGYYIGQTSDANGLKSNTSTVYTNTISLNDDGTANIISSGAYLRFNTSSGQDRFRYYKSSSYTSQKAISLYAAVTGGTAEVIYYTTSVVTESEPVWDLDINTVSLRTASTGIYYSAEWNLTAEQVAQVESYGVIVTLADEETVPTLGVSEGNRCMWTSLNMEDLTDDCQAKGTGVLISGIMKDGEDNAARAAMQIRAAAYVKLTDGTVIVSDEKAYSLQEVMEKVDDVFETANYSDAQKKLLKAFYDAWAADMASWDLTEIPAYQA